ncbi:MAG: VWA domain-containing protein [Verrucomicrobia bacterium]|nr:VWA domain-containing protein [Verrucomicrobiota bacterium]
MNPPEQSFGFQYPWVLVLLAVLPLLGMLGGRAGADSAVTFSSLHLLNRLGRQPRPRWGGFSYPVILGLLLALGIFALARPQHLNTYKVVKESGVELIVAIDVSRSMLVEDIPYEGKMVNRLTASRAVIRNFLKRRPMDRIGLVAFAGRPYLVSPITLDHEWLQDSLSRITIGLVEDGTAIGSVIAASAKRLDKRDARSKVIVLLTDGANNSGNLAPVTAAELANQLGIKIHTIAVGTPGRHTIPTSSGPLSLNQEFDLETLQGIAKAAGGESFMAQDLENLERIFGYIDSLETTERTARTRVDPTDLFAPLVVLMFALALLRAIGQETWWRRSP